MRNERSETAESPYSDALLQAIENYKSGPPTPNNVTAYWKAKMESEGRKVRRDITVNQCTWTEQELQEPMYDVNRNPVEGMLVFVGKKFVREDGYSFLGKIFPRLQTSGCVIPPYYYRDIHQTSGWVKVEANPYSPNSNTDEEKIAQLSEERGYQGQRLITYILASYASKDLTGEYFD